jgi:hypothetical protein
VCGQEPESAYFGTKTTGEIVDDNVVESLMRWTEGVVGDAGQA